MSASPMNRTIFVYLMARKRNASVADTKLLFIICLLGLCHTTRGVHREKNTDGEKCIVKEEDAFKTPYTGHILSSITPQQPLHITVSFKDHDKDVHRDVVELSNSEVKHYKIRKDRRMFKDQYSFSKQIPKGWSPFKFTAGDSGLTLYHVTTKAEVTLATLKMESMENIGIEGNFSVCSGVSPEWQVSEGDQVGVKLDLQSNVMQQLEVTGDGNTLSTLKLPGGDADISANTTLTVNTTQRSSGYTVHIFNENTKEWLYIGKLSDSEPVLVLAGRRGNTHLRLKRNNLLQPPTTSSQQLQSPHNCSVSIVVAIIFAVLLVISLIGHVPHVRRLVTKMCKKGETSEPQEDTEAKKAFLPEEERGATDVEAYRRGANEGGATLNKQRESASLNEQSTAKGAQADGECSTNVETNHRGANERGAATYKQRGSVSLNEQSTAKGAVDDGESLSSAGTTDTDNNNSTEGEEDEHETRGMENRQSIEERRVDESLAAEGKQDANKLDKSGSGGAGNEEHCGTWVDKTIENWD